MVTGVTRNSALSANASQSLTQVHWSTPVDTNKPGGELFIHYGSPMVTAANTALVPVKLWTGSTDGFKIQAFAAGVSGTSPAPMYELSSDYSLPPHGWIPSYSPTLSLRNRLYYPGAGGTVYYRDRTDFPLGPNGLSGATGQIAFYGNALYSDNAAAFNSAVQISTPLLSDRYGDIYFGFIATGPNPANLVSGVARISVTGAGTWVSATAASGGDPAIVQVPLNSVPVLSNDQRTLYFAVTDGSTGYLTAVNSTTLAPISHVRLLDPAGPAATIFSNSSASPMVGPDGDVYFGVLESPCCNAHNDRGWMLHFDSSLAHAKTPGSFGWDTTAAVVPRNLIAGYSGSSSYLILTKYNNYAGAGTGDGVNKVAVLDPNVTMPDPIVSSVLVMKEVITVTGVTTEGVAPAVKEWCINTAAIDPFTKSRSLTARTGPCIVGTSPPIPYRRAWC